MSPTAAGMAVTLHLATALALWFATPVRNYEVPDQAIEVTMEEPAPPSPEPQPQSPPPAQPQQKATPPTAQVPAPATRSVPLGVPPVPDKPAASDKTTKEPLGVPPPPERSTEPPQVATAPPVPPREASPPKEAPPPEPSPPTETKLPAVEMPAAPLNMQDFVRAAPPPPPLEIVRPQPRVQPAPPPAAPTAPTVQQRPAPQFAPSPLGGSTPPQEQAPHPTPDAHTAMVNPAEANMRTRAANDYVWVVIRRFSQFLPDLRGNNQGGTVVIRAVIARDGRLIEANIARSSGVAALDKGMLEALRAAAPYPPLPPEIPGDRDTFTLPIRAAR